MKKPLNTKNTITISWPNLSEADAYASGTSQAACACADHVECPAHSNQRQCPSRTYAARKPRRTSRLRRLIADLTTRGAVTLGVDVCGQEIVTRYQTSEGRSGRQTWNVATGRRCIRRSSR